MIGLILFVALLGFTLRRSGLTWPERFVNDTFGTAQGVLYRPVGAVADFFRDVGRLSDVYKENEQLRKTVAGFTQDQVRYNSMKNDIEKLQQDLDFTTNQKNYNNYQYKFAYVLASGSNPYDKTIKIDLGEKDGIKPRMAVVTVDGLVGIVSKVSQFTSTVMPITELDPASPDTIAIAATISGKEKEVFGIVDYNKENQILQMSKISENARVEKDDIVITSGEGNLMPKGLIIGSVLDNPVGDFGLTHTATLKPEAQFDHLSEVFVVLAPDPEKP